MIRSVIAAMRRLIPVRGKDDGPGRLGDCIDKGDDAGGNAGCCRK